MSIENNGNKPSDNGFAAVLASLHESVENLGDEGAQIYKNCVDETLNYLPDVDKADVQGLIAKGNNYLQGMKLWIEPDAVMAKGDSEDIDRPLDINDPAFDRGFQALTAAALNAGNNNLISADDLQYFTNNHGEPLNDTNDLVYNPPVFPN